MPKDDHLPVGVFGIGAVGGEKVLPLSDLISAFRKAQEAVGCPQGSIGCFCENGSGPCIKVNAPVPLDNMKEILNITSRRLGTTDVGVFRSKTKAPLVRSNFHLSNS